MSKSQRKGRPESHLANRGVGVRWGLTLRLFAGPRGRFESLPPPRNGVGEQNKEFFIHGNLTLCI